MSDEYSLARTRYAEWGVDTDEAIARIRDFPISIHCWQADDVRGFESAATAASGGGILATGHYPGRARTIDAVAMNWQTHDILLGECKWGADAIDRKIVRELLDEKTPLVLNELPNNGEGWRVHHALFTRAGATKAARQELQGRAGLLVDLERLYTDLAVE